MWPLPDDWFIMLLVSSECPACMDLANVASTIVASAPETARHMIFVDGITFPEQSDNIALRSDSPFDVMGQRVTAPYLFDTLGVTATPTMLLLERDNSAWVVADAVEGMDREWLTSQLQRDMTTQKAHIAGTVTTTHPRRREEARG